MVKNSTDLIHKIMREEHSKDEWIELKNQFDEFIANATEAEIKVIEDSGAGETLSIIYSGLQLKNT